MVTKKGDQPLTADHPLCVLEARAADVKDFNLGKRLRRYAD